MTTEQLLANKARPIKVAQFGTGNFLRAFVDYMIDISNEKGVFDGDVVMVKQVPGKGPDRLTDQGSKYHVVLQGKKDGEIISNVRTITSVRGIVNPYMDYDTYMILAKLDTLRFLVSNTTEAGIVYDENDRFDILPALSYPGRLVQFLYARYEFYNGDLNRGLIILPVELIESNGTKLKECVLKVAKLWNLGDSFIEWIEKANTFCSTLVDRIVSGRTAQIAEDYPNDSMAVAAEPFGLWVIESDTDISSEWTLAKAGMPVVFTDDQRPYRECKVRILNGTHTAMALISFLCGKNAVADCMTDSKLRPYINRVTFSELVPKVPLPLKEAERFAHDVMERFENPYLNHKLIDISLNSVSKWKSRDLPTMREAITSGGRAECLIFSLAALLAFDTVTEDDGEQYYGTRINGEKYPIREDRHVVDAVQASCLDDVIKILARTDLWSEDLNKYGIAEKVYAHLDNIRTIGAEEALAVLMKQ